MEGSRDIGALIPPTYPQRCGAHFQRRRRTEGKEIDGFAAVVPLHAIGRIFAIDEAVLMKR